MDDVLSTLGSVNRRLRHMPSRDLGITPGQGGDEGAPAPDRCSRAVSSPSRLANVLQFAPFLLLLIQAVTLAFRVGVTVDEEVYIDSGRFAWQHLSGVEFMRYATGPLHQLFAALPSAIVEWVTGRAVGLGPAVILGRLVCVGVFGLGTLYALDRLLRNRVSASARIVTLFMVGLSPTFVAHSSLMTTDVAFVATALAFFVCLDRHGVPNSPRGYLREAIWFGLAFSAKQTAFVLLVPLFLQSVFDVRDRVVATSSASRLVASRLVPRLVRGGLRSMFAALVGVVVSWILSFGTMGVDIPWAGRTPVPLPAPIIGLLGQINHARVGHMNFLQGNVSTDGFATYFPVAWIAKSTPVEVLVAGFALLAVIVNGARPLSRRRRERRLPTGWVAYPCVAAALVVASAVTGNINNGVRVVLLPLVVVLAVATTTVVSTLTGPRRPSGSRGLGMALVALLVGSQAYSAAQAFPNNLAYFSPLTGGLPRAYNLLSDSNLDWGQDYVHLPSDQSNLILDYFGPDAKRLGLTAQPFDRVTDISAFRPDQTLVVSSFRLLVENRYLTEELRAIRPDRVYGVSLFAYRLDTEAKRHAAVSYLLGLLRAEGPSSEVRLRLACASTKVPDEACK